jgi:Neuraminidase (sialidase)
MNLEDRALIAPTIHFSPGPEYSSASRAWQGIPTIECARNGRLWAAWYSGGAGEGPENYVVLETRDDGGATWSSPQLVDQP